MSDLLKRLCWDDFRVVKAIGEAGNIAAAGLLIGTSHTTVFRRLGEIERTLQITLFERRRTGYVPTSVGTEVIAVAERLEIEIVGLTQRLAGRDLELTGHLRLTASDTLVSLLTPICADFRTLHPAVRIEIVVGNGALNLARGESDIAVRATNSPPENLVGRKVAYIAWAPYIRRTEPDGDHVDPTGSQERDWVSYSDELASLRAVKAVESHVPPQNVVFRANSVQTLAGAITAGIGAGYLPCMVGDLDPLLMRIGPVDPELSDSLWLLTHPDLRKSGRVHTFLEYCAAAIGKQRAVIEGRGPLPRAR